MLRLPLHPLRSFESRQLTFALCQMPRFVGRAPCRTVADGVIRLVVGPDYLHVCKTFWSYITRKLLLPLRPFPPKWHNIIPGKHTDTRTHHSRCHVLTQNSITFGQSTSALAKVRSLCRLLWNDYLMLRHPADKPLNNGTFPCLIAKIQNVDRVISVFIPSKTSEYSLSPREVNSLFSDHAFFAVF